jgi:hypothetical protein
MKVLVNTDIFTVKFRPFPESQYTVLCMYMIYTVTLSDFSGASRCLNKIFSRIRGLRG